MFLRESGCRTDSRATYGRDRDNPSMRLPIMTPAWLLAALSATACAPAFNWRQTAIAATPLAAMFPCKPEHTTREVSMGGVPVELHMHHCETAGVTTAVGHAVLPDPALAGPVLDQWRQATLATMRVSGVTHSAWRMERATVLPQALAVDAAGSAANGQALILKAAWFARGTEVYAALLYGPALDPEVGEVFFAGLRFP